MACLALIVFALIVKFITLDCLFVLLFGLLTSKRIIYFSFQVLQCIFTFNCNYFD